MTHTDYWHIHRPMPDDAKRRLKNLVTGDPVARLTPDGGPVMLLRVDGGVFAKAFSLNRDYLYRGDYTALPEENDYETAECFLTEDGLAGFSVTETGWLISVYSNQPWRGFLHMIVPFAGHASKLVCIVCDGHDSLVDAYAKTFGFKTIATTTDDTAVMTGCYGHPFMENFVRNHGHPHHVFMYRPGPNESERSIMTFDDYFKAYAFVDREISRSQS